MAEVKGLVGEVEGLGRVLGKEMAGWRRDSVGWEVVMGSLIREGTVWK